MLKLVKYEYRRNVVGIAVMLFAILGLQGYFLIAATCKNYDHVLSSGALLFTAAMVAVAGVLAYSVSLYSRELNAKTSYLTFMTPNSSAVILGAKLLATLILGVGFAALLGLFAVWDFAILRKVFPELDVAQIVLKSLLAQSNFNLTSLFITLAALALEFLIGFFCTVVVAYLAITLGATVLQNKKFKGLVSVLLFLGILFALNWLTSLIPLRYDYLTMREMLLSTLPVALIDLAFMVAAFILSAWLLEKKVSL